MLFFFNDPATTEIYTLSLHDALPISREGYSSRHNALYWTGGEYLALGVGATGMLHTPSPHRYSADRKSTRLNSSHSQISYAVFCLKKKINKFRQTTLIDTVQDCNVAQ